MYNWLCLFCHWHKPKKITKQYSEKIEQKFQKKTRKKKDIYFTFNIHIFNMHSSLPRRSFNHGRTKCVNWRFWLLRLPEFTLENSDKIDFSSFGPSYKKLMLKTHSIHLASACTMSIYFEGPTASIDATEFHYEATYMETLCLYIIHAFTPARSRMLKKTTSCHLLQAALVLISQHT